MNGVLCYVDGSRAYFTPYSPCWHNEPAHRNNPEAKRGWKPGTDEPLSAGELCRCSCCVRDWNDDGTPKWQVSHVYFDGPFETPAGRAYNGNSQFNVEAINSGQIAWLLPSSCGWPDGVSQFGIKAGTDYQEFCRLVRLAGGTVFEPRKDAE